MKLFSVETGAEINSFNVGTFVNSVIYSPDGKYGISGDMRGNITMWNLESGQKFRVLEGHTDNVNSLSLDHSGRLVSASDDGSIKFWDLESGSELISLVSQGKDTWITYTPDGLFDASQAAMKELYFTKATEIIGLEQFKDRYYEPGLLSKVLGYSEEPLRKSPGMSNLQLFPDVLVEKGSAEEGSLKIDLENQGGGIGKVKILINGKEVISDARENGNSTEDQNMSLTYDIKDHPYLIPGEENIVTVQAYNEGGYLVSKGTEVTYTPPDESTNPPRLFGIVVGSSNYRGEELDLNYAAKDAGDFANALQMVGVKLFGKENVDITSLTTDMAVNQWPTIENIETAFRTIGQSATSSDLIIVYMSGHGTNFGGVEGDFYYLTSDASNFDLNDPAIRETVAISSQQWTEFFKMVPALKQVMVIDACHSGQLADDIVESRGDKSSAELRALERMKDRTGMYILAGSAADAVSYETSVYGQGLLTYSLLQGMKGAALREEKFVDVMQLFEHAANTVPQLAKNIGGIQKPEVRVPFGGGSFDIGLVDEEVQAGIVLPNPKPIFLRSVFQNEETFDDDLNLSEQLDTQLRDLSAKGTDQAVVFVDARKYSGAYSLKGRYSKEGDTYNVDVRLFKGDEMMKRIEVRGGENQLGKLIIDKILSEINN